MCRIKGSASVIFVFTLLFLILNKSARGWPFLSAFFLEGFHQIMKAKFQVKHSISSYVTLNTDLVVLVHQGALQVPVVLEAPEDQWGLGHL